MDAHRVTFPTLKPVTARAAEVRRRLEEIEAHLAAHRAILDERQRNLHRPSVNTDAQRNPGK